MSQLSPEYGCTIRSDFFLLVFGRVECVPFTHVGTDLEYGYRIRFPLFSIEFFSEAASLQCLLRLAEAAVGSDTAHVMNS